ncbi:hypothetical protein IC235_16385 [Hymenobacter sp. BT664]|uniref:Uncharacterized protein n=1 Tax=Hymenobacter montanus TaxID=2771359 RepID=A0A927BGH1_9BACT|nr:hypothetical protein [Hymenobacter montanus]MBD2769468.1 hypothetical protein [Hymenobacter montanus]
MANSEQQLAHNPMMYPFEIHLTTRELSADQLASFVQACDYLAAKPLLIELAQGSSTTQPMLSKVVHQSNLDAALAAAAAAADYLERQHLSAVRVKIETPASYAHLATPGGGAAFRPYFEWHGKVPYQQVEVLLALCAEHRAHLSVNALKHNGTTRFVTLREFGDAAIFQARVAALTAALHPQWPLLKQESECCVYDSNTTLDAGWLPQ